VVPSNLSSPGVPIIVQTVPSIVVSPAAKDEGAKVAIIKIEIDRGRKADFRTF
jgi:hypothetical protein